VSADASEQTGSASLPNASQDGLTPSESSKKQPHPGMLFVEFVIVVAALMALNALAMDIMLPALPEIGQAFNIVNENDRQQVLIAYMIGFGVAQLFFGPVSDAFGRRKVLLGGLFLYSLASIGSLMANTLDHLLLARLVQGIGCAATRVVAVSLVRDSYSGRQMGKVMSLVMMIFIAVPIVAPSIGQVILLFADWHWIFSTLLFAGLVLFFWCYARLPETLSAENRQPLEVRAILNAYSKVITTRTSLGYMIALSFVFGGLFAFISMSQQIFVDIFDLGPWFPVVFACAAVSMAIASFTNSRLVEKLGMRQLSQIATIAFTLLGSVMLLLALFGLEMLWSTVLLSAGIMASFGFIGPNFNAMAMEPLGDIAGTASSVIGFATTLGGAILGFTMGQMFDGTTVPLALAYTLYGAGGFLAILFAERGKLFQPHHDDPKTQ